MSDDWNKLKHLVDLSAENARLKAEVEAYRSASDEVAAAFLALPAPHNQVARVCEGIESLKAEVERLTKAEVERLRKEGEAMYPNLGPGWSHNAKEGKQP